MQQSLGDRRGAARRLAREAAASATAHEPSPGAAITAGTTVEAFVEVARSSAVRAMLGTLGVGVSDANRLRRRPEGFARRPFRRVGVLGAGLMGSGIAYTCARAGMEVLLVDVDLAAAERGIAALARQDAAAIAAGREEAVYSEARLKRIRAADYADLAEVDIVVEAVFEDRAVKALSTARAEAVIRADCLFATNTSTLPISGLAEASRRPERFIGLHFFSPVPRMPLLEIICGAKTSQATLAEALDFAQAIGKTPIVVQDRRGFFTSRVIMTYQSEAFAMLAEGVSPESIEAAGKASGMPLPPLALSDVVALDLIHQINVQTRRDGQAKGEPTRAQAVVARMVEEFGRFGKKNGKGFYDYHADGSKSLWPDLAEHFPANPHNPSDLSQLRSRLLGVQALEAFRCLDEGVISSPVEGDVGAVVGWNFPSSTGGPLSYIDGLGVGQFVASCDRLAAEVGDRFSVPASLRRLAAEGRTVRAGIP